MEKSDTKMITLENVVITGVTQPSTILRIAKEHELNAQDVFVRVYFEYNKQVVESCNKLRFFGKEGYQKLLDAVKNETPLNIVLSINTKGSFIYLEDDSSVTVDDLFNDETNKSENPVKDIANFLK